MKGDGEMHSPRIGSFLGFPLFVAIAILVIPAISLAEDYKVFTSEEYGFSMKYPANWVKIDNPKGNYYVVFQAPDLVDGFRNRIHVAAHKPVKDPLNVFLQELRNGIKDLQGKAEKKDKQEVRIVDEGEFRSEVPGVVLLFHSGAGEQAQNLDGHRYRLLQARPDASQDFLPGSFQEHGKIPPDV